ncbi:hypothetical protein SPONL_2088 [uncultured Candidatus Thioglobus sp.]|nr:hypothetical protein SPONL_2088 [uncultured Candidatus Thioglobus sp.]
MTLNLIKTTTWLWIFAIAYLSLSPGSEPPTHFTYFDKLLHLGSYGLLTLLALSGYAHLKKSKVAIGIVCYSIVIESLQLLAENRWFEIADIVANIIGVVLAVILLIKFTKSSKV